MLVHDVEYVESIVHDAVDDAASRDVLVAASTRVKRRLDSFIGCSHFHRPVYLGLVMSLKNKPREQTPAYVRDKINAEMRDASEKDWKYHPMKDWYELAPSGRGYVAKKVLFFISSTRWSIFCLIFRRASVPAFI